MDDGEINKWIADAEEAGWNGIDEIIQATVDVHGARGDGLWRCDSCDAPVADPAVCDDGDCTLLTARDGIGVTIMCTACYDAAQAAREKIIVHVYDDDDDDDGREYCEEDRSALTEEECELAEYLDAADEGVARQSRDLINAYPRDEQRNLHRFQNEIDRERSLRGKAVD